MPPPEVLPLLPLVNFTSVSKSDARSRLSRRTFERSPKPHGRLSLFSLSLLLLNESLAPAPPFTVFKLQGVKLCLRGLKKKKRPPPPLLHILQLKEDPPSLPSLFAAATTSSSTTTTPATAIDHRSLRLLDDQRCVYVFVLRKRAVAQPLEPVWWKSSLQARSLRPQRHNVFHVRDRARLQSFMSSPLFQTEDPEKSPTKILLSY
ncbi:hypothetical protein INR49_018760 [Scomber scombrus]|uniref:Uncharacterized protein n=1 Tax=Scomber scombrus TaxID=13677 RepID=A0AAV1Q957_SCOSC